MRHRPGVTLVEVLVAIFIMAIAMLALLALFPLGALSMAQALKDDRCATCAVNAEALAVALDLRHDALVAGAFTNPFGATSNLTQAAGYAGPSFGVIVDPFMYLQDPAHAVGPFAGPPAAAATTGVPRCSISFSQVPMTRATAGAPMSATEAARWCSMLDGITWVRGDNVGLNGVPDTSSTGGANIIRDGRYTWAWLLRRPLWYSDAVIDMSVIIYSGRPTASGVTGEPTFPVVAGGAAGTNSVTIDYSTTGVKPSIRNGGWILDVTPTLYTPPGGNPVQVVYGYPYRVVNATDTGATQVTLELQTALRGPNNVTTITALEYAVEIIDRGSFVQP